MTIQKREANLDIFPTALDHNYTHVSLGDIHGNALKLIYTLIEEGFLKLDKDQYEQLRDIYKTPTRDLTKEQIETFELIIANAGVSDQRALTLIGDELADRGENDYFTLLVLKKLREANIDMDIMISNHSMEFIKDYERASFTGKYDLGGGQGASLANMNTLIKKGLVQEDQVRSMVDFYYKPIVKAIGYTLSEDGEVTLFSHAPIGLETVKALADKFKIPYKDATPKELFQTIDAINETVRNKFKNKELTAILSAEGYSNPDLPIPTTKPLMRLVWNRAIGNELITETSSGIKVKFVHGHIGDGEILKNGKESLKDSHENLDTSFAKAPGLFKTSPSPLYPTINILHLTRQSSNFTQKQLTDEKLKEFGS